MNCGWHKETFWQNITIPYINAMFQNNVKKAFYQNKASY